MNDKTMEIKRALSPMCRLEEDINECEECTAHLFCKSHQDEWVRVAKIVGINK